MCVERNAELPAGDPNRKFKGRSAFGGDRAFDDDGRLAVFQELGSSPATVEATRRA